MLGGREGEKGENSGKRSGFADKKRGEEWEGTELLEGCAKPEGNGPGKAHRAKNPEEKTEKMEEEERSKVEES